MTDSTGKRHPFLDDLADDVVLTTNALTDTVSGKEAVLRVVKAGSTVYARQTPTYHKKIDESRTLFEYDAELVGGRTVHAAVIIDWNGEGKASKLFLTFAPLGGALAFALRVGEILDQGDRSKGL